jgi:hypothetical protein
MAALMLQVERLFAFDKTQPAAQADSRDNNGEEFITKESQQHKTKGVRLMKELL